MMGIQDDKDKFEQNAENNNAENPRRRYESWKPSGDRPWQTLRKLMPPAMIFQNLAKSTGPVDELEKRISNIDAKLEKITHLVSCRFRIKDM